MVVENNSCKWIRGSRNVSWSQVSAGITRPKNKRTDQYAETLNKLLLPVLQIQLVREGQQGKNGKKNYFPLDLILSNLIHIHPSMSE